MLDTSQVALYLVFPATLVALLAVSYATVSYFAETHSFSYAPVLALWFTLLTFAVVPVDILNVSRGNATPDFALALYEGIYTIIFLFVFIGVPFGYTWLKGQDDVSEDPSAFRASRVRSSALAALPGVILAAAVVAAGTMLTYKPAVTDAWYLQVFDTTTASLFPSTVRFVVAVLGLMGAAPFAIYTGYGLSYVPVSYMWGAMTDYEVRLTIRGLARELDEVKGLLQNDETLRNKARPQLAR